MTRGSPGSFQMNTVVIFLAVILCSLPALAKGGPLSLYGAFDPRRDPHLCALASPRLQFRLASFWRAAAVAAIAIRQRKNVEAPPT